MLVLLLLLLGGVGGGTLLRRSTLVLLLALWARLLELPPHAEFLVLQKASALHAALPVGIDGGLCPGGATAAGCCCGGGCCGGNVVRLAQ